MDGEGSAAERGHCAALAGLLGGSAPSTTREKGAGIDALGGAAAVGHPGAGGAVGSALGLGYGALIGDPPQGEQMAQDPSSSKSARIRPKSNASVEK